MGTNGESKTYLAVNLASRRSYGSSVFSTAASRFREEMGWLARTLTIENDCLLIER